MKKLVTTTAAAALTALALAGCSMTSTNGSNGSNGSASGSAAHAATGGAAGSSDALTTATSSLGTIVIDGKGMTVYFYNKDKPDSGTSVCTGGCASLWPAVTTTTATPSVKGVTGTIGTITDPAGSKQITIDGRPIYTYAADSKAGDVNGQGVQGTWYVVSPSGKEITGSASGSGSGSGSGSNSSGY